MKIVCLFSGGCDSTTMLYLLKSQGHQLLPLTLTYQQRHIKEIEMAEKTCTKLGLPQLFYDLPQWHHTSALSSKYIDMPEGHYTDENMKKTVVPARNLIFLSFAIGVAIDNNYEAVAYAAHKGDEITYPDCCPTFVQKMQEVAKVCDYKSIHILTPFLYDSKEVIIKKGIELGVDYSLAWSCYRGEEEPCLKCGSCNARIGGFKKNNVRDPLVKEEVWKKL